MSDKLKFYTDAGLSEPLEESAIESFDPSSKEDLQRELLHVWDNIREQKKRINELEEIKRKRLAEAKDKKEARNMMAIKLTAFVEFVAVCVALVSSLFTDVNANDVMVIMAIAAAATISSIYLFVPLLEWMFDL